MPAASLPLVLLAALTAACSYGQERKPETVTYGTRPDDAAFTTTTAAPGPSPTTTAARPAAAPSPAAKPTTTTAPRAAADTAMVTIVSTYPGRMVVMLNGVEHVVEANATVGPVAVRPAAQDADWYRIANDVATCARADSDDLFDPGRSYTLRIASKPGPDRCDGTGLPVFTAVLDPGGRLLV